jgi:acetolactate synthase I/III small subunit
MEKQYTISILTENKVGLLNRVTIILTRRNINIESLNTSESEVHGIYRYTLVIRTTEEQALKVVKQIEKLVEVVGAYMYEDNNIIFQEIALYKIPTSIWSNGNNIEQIIRDNHARILTIEPEYIVIEKTGHKKDTQELFDKLEPFGILEFVRSGRVAISKPMKHVTTYLKELEEANTHSNKAI